MDYSLVETAKRKIFVILASIFTLAFNISMYKGYTLLFSQIIVILITLNYLKISEAICKRKKAKKTMDSESENLKNIQPLTKDEINSFTERVNVTPLTNENKKDFIFLREKVCNKIDSLNNKK